MTDRLRGRPLRLSMSVLLVVAGLGALVPLELEDPDRALRNTVAGALAADDPLLEVAIEQYPERAPAIAITYGHLDLFREQLARFGPQVVPIVAAYQASLTTADALQIAGQAVQSVRDQLAGEAGVDLTLLTPEERGLIALLKMRDEGNAFVGQWEITAAGEARRVPSRLLTLAGPELLLGGLTDLERRIVQEREVDWRSYGLAAVDLAAIASGVALLRFTRAATRGMRTASVASRTVTPRSGALATARVLGINAVKYGLPVGLVVIMVGYPDVFTHYLWVLAESFGVPGIVGPLIGWSLVIVPAAFLLPWVLLSARLFRIAGWLLAASARGCRHLAVHLAVADRR